MRAYSSSLPFDSFHRRYITDASTFAGDDVFGSLSNDMTDNKIVLKQHTTIAVQRYQRRLYRKILNFLVGCKPSEFCLNTCAHKCASFVKRIKVYRSTMQYRRNLKVGLWVTQSTTFKRNTNTSNFTAYLTFWVGFQRSQASSPLWGSSMGGCNILMQRSPFWK